jgi:hypothetical protein
VTVVDASADQEVDATGLDTPFGTNASARQHLLFGLLCPGDELGCDALMEFALASGRVPAADMLYADEIRVSPASHEREPFCKPDFSPDLLLSTNYIGRPWFATPALLARADLPALCPSYHPPNSSGDHSGNSPDVICDSPATTAVSD